MISDKLSHAFFGFSLRRLGAELQGGSQQPPPPHQVVENPEAHQGAGYYTGQGWGTSARAHVQMCHLFRISETAGRIAQKFGLWPEAH